MFSILRKTKETDPLPKIELSLTLQLEIKLLEEEKFVWKAFQWITHNHLHI